MSFHSIIKIICLGFCMVFSFIGTSQEEQQIGKTENTEEKSSIFNSTERQKYLVFSAGYQNPIATGDNFIGNALKGTSGFDVKFKLFVYKQFFLEYNISSSKFRVENKTLVGDYRRTSISSSFLYFGYELLPLPDVRLGINAALFGQTKMVNRGFNLPEAIQRDSGRLSSYGIYIAYEFHPNISVYVDYAYRSIKTNINVPQELEKQFRKGTYQTIGLGVMLTMGKKDLVSRFID